MRIKVVWGSLPNVDLTAGAAVAASGENVEQEIGNAYVIDAGGHVKPNTSASVVKVQTGSLTFSATDSDIETYTGSTWRASTAEERDLLHNKTLTVKLAASDQLRIMAAGDLTNGAVGAYTAGTAITLGTVKITSSSGTVSYAYTAAYDVNGETADAGLNFRYSASPKNTTGAASESTGAEYGTLTASLDAAV